MLRVSSNLALTSPSQDHLATIRKRLTSPNKARHLRFPDDPEAVPYYLFVPNHIDPTARPVVAVHGIARRADEHLAAFEHACARTGRMLVAPLFSEARFWRYQKVVVDDSRADQALLSTLREVEQTTRIETGRVDMFGFSGGAQFAHRFALLHPPRVGRLAVASAGWFTMPELREPFPYGLASGDEYDGRFQPDLEGFLKIPTLILVGERDIERDSSLRKGRRIDRRQGVTRVERARRWENALQRAARKVGTRPQARLRVLPDCGHSFETCVRIGGLPRIVVNWFGAK
jgi:pimeloyl-ACP methyl ester carboxylesterase